MFIVLAIIFALFAAHSFRTGKTYIAYREIDRREQPRFFVAQVYTLTAMAVGSLVMAILGFLGVVN